MRTPDIEANPAGTVYVVEYPGGEAGQDFMGTPRVRAIVLATRVPLPDRWGGGRTKTNGVRVRLEERLRVLGGTYDRPEHVELEPGHEFVVVPKSVEPLDVERADERTADRELRYAEQDAVTAGIEAQGGPQPTLKGDSVIFDRSALAAWLTAPALRVTVDEGRALGAALDVLRELPAPWSPETAQAMAGLASLASRASTGDNGLDLDLRLIAHDAAEGTDGGTDDAR
jgi:hypothetical protein